MGELLGIGLTHYPPLCGLDEDMTHLLKVTLDDDSIPSHHRDPAAWPAAMRAEWADDEGHAAAADHRLALVEAFGEVRRAIDEFEPDTVIIVGDDQYENFQEDIVPPFAVLAYGDVICRPWGEAHNSSAMEDRANVWGEPHTTEFLVPGSPELAKLLATGLLERDIDVAYAYRQLHHPSLSHAFINAILFLDYERTGFSYPVIPLAVNCYGSSVISRKGFMTRFDDQPDPDPPSPSPRRLMAVGAAIADVVDQSDLRVALIASSSWSHAFLCDKTWRLRPDTPADRRLYDEMVRGSYDELSARSVADLEESGQQEVLNWFVLFGAMQHMHRTPGWTTLVETDIFNSNKVFAVYPT
jgi:hypothetical protein